MTDNSSSFGLSFLDPSTMHNSPINKEGIKSVSTPINRHEYNNDNLSPVDITEILSNKNVRTPLNKPDKKKEKPQSILKNSPNKSTSTCSRNEIPDSLLKKHPELKIASQNGELNPVKCARVIFSPTKEIISYRKEYLESLSNSNDDTGHLRHSKPEKKSETYNKAYDDDYTIDLTKNDDNYDIPRSSNDDSKKSKESVLTRLITDPTIPYVLSLYLQLFFNLLLISIVLYFVFIFIKTIKSDINHKLEIYTSDALQEISLCSREYYRNKCSTENGNTRAPALEKSCTMWGKCMNRDPQLIGKSKITAETFADILNGFIKPISWKSLVFMNLLIFGSLFITNIAFGSYRSSSNFDRSKEDKEKLINLENKVKEQNDLLVKYKELEKKINELNNNANTANNSYITAYAGNTSSISSSSFPRKFNNQMIIHDNSHNSSFASPLLNRKR